MQEFEPKRKNKILTKEFIGKYAYVLVLAVLLIGGISYGYTFFIQNKKIASGSITTAALTINFTDRSINATGLSVPSTNQEGLSEFSKSITITNQTTVDGRVKLTLTRTSGLALTDMSYALVVNGAMQEINDVPTNGEILSTAIMGSEVIDVEVRLWPKTTYTGSETTFNGNLVANIKYLGSKASNLTSSVGKYVNFNCSTTCEVWQIVKVEDGRLVLTKQTNYSGATSRTNSNRYNPASFNPAITFNDDSMITSLSTDGLNVYLAKTVKINDGSGTQADPYTLVNTDFREPDKKVIAVITYKDDDNTTLGTQNVYYGETNYISRTMNDASFQYWTDGTNHYVLGDTISFTSDTNLTAVKLQQSTLTLTNNSVALVNGTNGENPYTYNGDGALSCTSSDPTKVLCNVDSVNNKIILDPELSTTTNVTITVSGVNGVNYLAPTSQTFTVSVAIPTIASCQGCEFVYTTNEYFIWSDDFPDATRADFANNNDVLVDDYATLHKNVFLGFKFDLNGNITNAYSCGIKGTDRILDSNFEVLNETSPGLNAGTAFCVEADASISSNGNLITGPTLWNDSDFSIGRCTNPFSWHIDCNGSVSVNLDGQELGVYDMVSNENCSYSNYVDDHNHFLSCG